MMGGLASGSPSRCTSTQPTLLHEYTAHGGIELQQGIDAYCRLASNGYKCDGLRSLKASSKWSFRALLRRLNFIIKDCYRIRPLSFLRIPLKETWRNVSRLWLEALRVNDTFIRRDSSNVYIVNTFSASLPPNKVVSQNDVLHIYIPELVVSSS